MSLRTSLLSTFPSSLLAAAAVAAVAPTSEPGVGAPRGHDEHAHVHPLGNKDHAAEQINYSLDAATGCTASRADIYPCDDVDLLGHLPLQDIGGGNGNDVWGWSRRGREFALMGRSNGTAFVEITDPENPRYLGNLATNGDSSTWRDIKVYANHAFIVADNVDNHGMQVFALSKLLSASGSPREFEADAIYDEFGSAHNIVINEESGFAYAVGGDDCAGGLHMIDIRNPTAPAFAGCFDADGYTHDAQCVIYRGPDADYRGREVCFAANEDTLTLVDVTDKARPEMISRNAYEDAGYAHQGWLTEDHRYFLLDDEGDERRPTDRTRTVIWELDDLESPRVAGVHVADGVAVDHNQYVRGDYVYQANYRRGLRILYLDDLARGRLEEVAFFDTYPESDGNSFDGAWSVYPFFASGNVVVSDRNRGLFVLEPRLAIFSEDFESGDLARWSNVRGPGVSVVQPGLSGSDHALQIAVDGSATPSFALSKDPKRETSVSARLLLKANRVDLGNGEVEILRLLARGGRTVATLSLEQEGPRYWVKLHARSGNALELVGSAKVPANRAIPITLEWERASERNAEDGVARLKRKKRVKAATTTLANGTLVVGSLRLGLPDGSAGTEGSGAFLVDRFVVTP